MAKTKGMADSTDIFVGERIKTLRAAAGMSQEKLAEALGITFQQVQKYEAGKNRVAAGRLMIVAATLGVPITSFFPDQENKASDILEAQRREIEHLKTLIKSVSRQLAEAGK